ncbi:MAG TPA: hypothetical protein VG649_20465, partial [Candidatus Angelobacter sp.]|nr:hypothetical protein [Candidatus Angelobacter sp.]
MHLDFLASKELGGRYTLAPNFAVSARYLAAHLKAYGFRGAGTNGDFLQFFDVTSTKPDVAKMLLSYTVNGETSSYKYGDFFVFGAEADADVQGELVFVGYGISSPSQKYDDYSGLDVKGKIILIANGVPEGIDEAKLGEQERGEKAALAHGAAAALVLPAERSVSFLRNFRERSQDRESVGLSKNNEV